jgi:catechol 2,3-dioxygenase
VPLIPYARLSHFGILVHEMDRMVAFYSRILGLTLSDRGPGPRGDGEYAFLSRDPAEHHQVVFKTGRKKDAPSQIVQMSFEMGSLADLRVMHGVVVTDEEATEVETRAHGISWSLYFKDPEQNIIEAFVTSPWYIPAPSAVPFDFSMTDEQIFHTVQEAVKKRPGYKPFRQWSEEAEKRMLETGAWPARQP